MLTAEPSGTPIEEKLIVRSSGVDNPLHGVNRGRAGAAFLGRAGRRRDVALAKQLPDEILGAGHRSVCVTTVGRGTTLRPRAEWPPVRRSPPRRRGACRIGGDAFPGSGKAKAVPRAAGQGGTGAGRTRQEVGRLRGRPACRSRSHVDSRSGMPQSRTSARWPNLVWSSHRDGRGGSVSLLSFLDPGPAHGVLLPVGRREGRAGTNRARRKLMNRHGEGIVLQSAGGWCVDHFAKRGSG